MTTFNGDTSCLIQKKAQKDLFLDLVCRLWLLNLSDIYYEIPFGAMAENHPDYYFENPLEPLWVSYLEQGILPLSYAAFVCLTIYFFIKGFCGNRTEIQFFLRVPGTWNFGFWSYLELSFGSWP